MNVLDKNIERKIDEKAFLEELNQDKLEFSVDKNEDEENENHENSEHFSATAHFDDKSKENQ